ncbi:MAG TPA: hypothetical protein VGQ36_08975 [Thermoanaerobaculia bacterium]|jgi:hypothetical protein|nr:hypothetical protein [Thermoanaerobaculia bacterium]
MTMMLARGWRKFPERRHSTRFLTLKNAAWIFGGLLALFIAYSAYNEMRPRNASRGRLYERGSAGSVTTTVRKPAEVIEEGRRSSHDGFATPSLAEPARPLPRYVPPPEQPISTLKTTRQRGGRTVITGDADGLRVDVRPATTTETAPPPERF